MVPDSVVQAEPDSKVYPDRMSFSERLKQIRAAKGLSLQEVANRVDVARQTVHEWETGKSSPRMERIEMLARALQVSQSDLLDGEAPLVSEPIFKYSAREPEVSYSTLQPILAWEHPEDLPEGEFVMVPRLGVKLSAGNGHEQVEIEFGKVTPQAFRAAWVREKRLRPNKLAAMTASGNSMEPGIFNGDSLLVDTSQTEVLDGKVYALWYDGGERVKRLFRLPGGGLRIKSDNSDHPTVEVPQDQLEHVRILGRVVHRSGDGGLW